MALRFTYARLLVDDYRRSFFFYRDVLGVACGFGDQDSGYAELVAKGIEVVSEPADHPDWGIRTAIRNIRDIDEITFRFATATIVWNHERTRHMQRSAGGRCSPGRGGTIG
jgi:hypothetical protein